MKKTEDVGRPLRIAMLGQKQIPSREGGIEVVVQELATRMVEKGCQVTCYNRSGHHVCGEEFDRGPMKEYHGVRLKRVFTIQKKGIAALTAAASAAVCTAVCGYDVVHIHAEGPAFMSWIPKLTGKRVIVTVHGLDHQRAKWGSFAAACIMQGERNAVKYADEIIVLSRAVQKYFWDTYHRQTRFIPNGVNRPEIREPQIITEQYGLMKDDYILFLGRLVPEKGLKYLIEAYRYVKTSRKLVIAGGRSDTGEFEAELHEMAKGDERIIFTGFIQGQTLEELYSNCYVYVLPSDLEGMPLSLLEAMSYGNCCLTSDIEECATVTKEHGITFRKGNVEDFREKLQMLCDQPSLVEEYRGESSEYILARYNWDKVVDETLALYRNELREESATDMKQDFVLRDLLYLLGCSLNKQEPDPQLVAAMDQGAILRLARRHMIGAMIALPALAGLQKLPESEQKETVQKAVASWKNSRDMAIRRTMINDAERKTILAWFEEHGYWYMPLKGMLLKDAYPVYGMREMSDSDILMDPNARKELHDYMIARGYNCGDYNRSNHDEYWKGMNRFEFHVSLFMEYDRPEWYRYYENIKSRLIKDPSNGQGWKFTPEDYYVYMTAHAYGHCEHAGTGLRTLADAYILRRSLPENLDRNYVEEQLQKLGALGFERRVTEMADKLFTDPAAELREQLTAEEYDFLEFMAASGVYGSSKTAYENKLKKLAEESGSASHVKVRYVLHRIFPDMTHMKTAYPILKTHIWLLPGCWIHRVVRNVRKGRRELKQLRKA